MSETDKDAWNLQVRIPKSIHISQHFKFYCEMYVQLKYILPKACWWLLFEFSDYNFTLISYWNIHPINLHERGLEHMQE